MGGQEQVLGDCCGGDRALCHIHPWSGGTSSTLQRRNGLNFHKKHPPDHVSPRISVQLHWADTLLVFVSVPPCAAGPEGQDQSMGLAVVALAIQS